MPIRVLQPTDERGIQAAARIAMEAFAGIAFCDTTAESRKEVLEALHPGYICLAAYDDDGEMLGWIGGRHSYAFVWELHPLAVKPTHQRKGVGSQLVLDLEARIFEAGGVTVFLGADDETGGTNLFGKELYPNVLDHAQRIKNVGDHPYIFYQKMGYTVTGLIPDANGIGKPDILMCKRMDSRVSSIQK